ncbi:TetR family transcriptional regulator [Streptomyces sp. AJS327]|uniref:TetR/AcrR family transcriptional regulator n=1 Tax=Streptomyces sp. AJS327 TaxID=2545265 RepID=UPI0015DF68C4|nr:TetR/AcrR family transcriptional regulator C-terminal domain-containing protein [Streptomyces sp. AJS327]MBA0052510.1 TetR family transcriptional regulator [Streptomyces sp. AJS327]
MPRPRSLTEAQLAAAALEIIDGRGLAALSMRAVAAELGVSTMALYRYVDDRHGLEGLVVEFVLDEMASRPEDDPAAPWARRIEAMVERLRTAVTAHPAAIPLTLAHRHRSLAVRRWSETVLGILTEAGVEGERRVIALRGLLGYVIGAIQLEHLSSLSGAGTAALSELPDGDFPHLRETARYARGVGPDREFSGGLAVFLRGLAADPGSAD